MTYINLKDFDLQIENPIDKNILDLLLKNLQYRYDNPKLKDHPWIVDTNGFFIQLERRTNTNGKYVGIYLWAYPKHFDTPSLIGAMVKSLWQRKENQSNCWRLYEQYESWVEKAMIILLDRKRFYEKYS